jgi:hypothetical protein
LAFCRVGLFSVTTLVASTLLKFNESSSVTLLLPATPNQTEKNKNVLMENINFIGYKVAS